MIPRADRADQTLGITRSSKVDVELRFYPGVIHCKVIHKKKQIGPDKYFNCTWGCPQVDVQDTSSPPRNLGVIISEWMRGENREKAEKGAKFLGLFGLASFNFFKAREKRSPDDVSPEGVHEDLMDGLAATGEQLKGANGVISGIKEGVKGVGDDYDAVTSNVGLGPAGEPSANKKT